jgi:hypothetical protein
MPCVFNRGIAKNDSGDKEGRDSRLYESDRI